MDFPRLVPSEPVPETSPAPSFVSTVPGTTSEHQCERCLARFLPPHFSLSSDLHFSVRPLDIRDHRLHHLA